MRGEAGKEGKGEAGEDVSPESGELGGQHQAAKQKFCECVGWNVTSATGCEFTSQTQEAKESRHVLLGGPRQPWNLGGVQVPGPSAPRGVSPAPLRAGGALIKRGSASGIRITSWCFQLGLQSGQVGGGLTGELVTQPGSSPGVGTRSVDRKGTGTVDAEPPEEDPQPFPPGAAHHAVQQPPVHPLPQPHHLHPRLDHV